MRSRDKILESLRVAQRPFPDVVSPPDDYLPMVPIGNPTAEELRERFVAEAEKLACIVHQSADSEVALETVLELLADQRQVMSWDLARIPIPNLADGLASAGIALADNDDATVETGLSGADGALAATGSLIVQSGAGRSRSASLLPPVHIAVITADQIVADFETWVAQQRAAGVEKFREISNVTLVSGASRTADIAMQLVMGMHGPGTLHIVIV